MRLAFLLVLFLLPCSLFPQSVIVGSKKFTESYVLGEIAKKTVEDAGFKVEHKQGIGATGIVWSALKKGDIGLYPEYTGTISEEILKKPGLDVETMQEELKKLGIGMSKDLGFNDGYGLAMRRSEAERLGIKKISMGEAAYLADRIVLMREGRIVQEGTLDDFRQRPAEPFVAEFMNAQRPAVTI